MKDRIIAGIAREENDEVVDLREDDDVKGIAKGTQRERRRIEPTHPVRRGSLDFRNILPKRFGTRVNRIIDGINFIG